MVLPRLTGLWIIHVSMYNGLLVSITTPACRQELTFSWGHCARGGCSPLHFQRSKSLSASRFCSPNVHLPVFPQTRMPSLWHPSPKTFRIKTCCSSPPHHSRLQMELWGELESLLSPTSLLCTGLCPLRDPLGRGTSFPRPGSNWALWQPEGQCPQDLQRPASNSLLPTTFL